MKYDPFTVKYDVPAHGDTIITAVYTNHTTSVDAWIEKVEVILAAGKLKLVGVDVEYTQKVYTRNRGNIQKAAVISLSVGQECLVYHISCAADGISEKFDSFLRNWHYRFAGFDIPTDKTMLYRSATPLFIMNHVDIHAIWRNPDKSSRRKESLMDVAALFVDKSYKDYDGGLTKKDHLQWGSSPLSKKHKNYAAKNAYAAYELFRQLDIHERGFFHRLYTKKPEYKRKEWGWGW